MAVISLFSPSSGDYSTRSAAISRQKKLADALAQIAQQETPVSTVGGITAPVSPMGALARGLTSFGGSYLARKASEEEAALKKAGSEELVKAISQFGKPYKTVDEAAPTVMEPGGEPIQQYTMRTPDSGEMMGEAARVMGLGVPGSEAIGAKLYSTASDAAERETAYNRLKPIIDQIPDEQARTYFDIAAKADPAKAAAAFGEAGVEIIKPKKPKDLPASVDEYNFAQTPEGGGFKGSYTDWLKTKTGATTRITVDGGQPRMQQGSVFSLPDGRKVSAVFDPNRGQYGIVDNSGKFNPLPEGARPTTAGVGNPLSRSQYFKLKNDYRTEGTALTKMNRYFKTVGDANTGFAKLADQIAAKTRTAFGSKTLTPEQLNSQVGEGQLQGLLGLFRTDIVGPGVMTEYDAERVLRALGGDFKLLQNPAVVKSLLQDIYADKMSRVRDYEAEINFNSQYFPGDVKPKIDVPETLGGGTSAAPASGGWTTLPNGVRIRERK